MWVFEGISGQLNCVGIRPLGRLMHLHCNVQKGGLQKKIASSGVIEKHTVYYLDDFDLFWRYWYCGERIRGCLVSSVRWGYIGCWRKARFDVWQLKSCEGFSYLVRDVGDQFVSGVVPDESNAVIFRSCSVKFHLPFASYCGKNTMLKVLFIAHFDSYIICN